MKTRKNNNLKIALATGTCIFTLATAFTGTVAWFSTNLSAKTSGLSVTVKAGSNIKLLSCYAIRYDGNYGALATNVMNGGQVLPCLNMTISLLIVMLTPQCS